MCKENIISIPPWVNFYKGLTVSELGTQLKKLEKKQEKIKKESQRKE